MNHLKGISSWKNAAKVMASISFYYCSLTADGAAAENEGSTTPESKLTWQTSSNSLGMKSRETAVGECTTLSSTLRGDTKISARVQLGLSAIGVVAGSIIVPGLSASASASRTLIAAFGGVSGAVNGMQYAWNQEGMGASARNLAYEKFKKEIQPLLDKADNQANEADAIFFYRKVEEYCRLTPPIANASDTTSGYDEAVQTLQNAATALAKATTLQAKAQDELKAARSRNDPIAEAAAQQAANTAAANIAATKEVLTKAQTAIEAASALQISVQKESTVKAVQAANEAIKPANNSETQTTPSAQSMEKPKN